MKFDLPRIAEIVTHTIAIAAAWRRTRPGKTAFAPALRPLLWFLATTLVADLVRVGFHWFVLKEAPRPFTGTTRAIFHLDEFGVVGWNAGLTMVAAIAFAERSERKSRLLLPILLGACLAWGALIGGYPIIRGEKLERVYFALELLTVFACTSSAVHAWLRDRWFGVAARAVSILVVAEAATLLGPFLGEPLKYWATANVISACAYLVLVWELRRSKALT